MTKLNGGVHHDAGTTHSAALKVRGPGKPQGLYKSLIGKTVLIPASEFAVDIPELWYKARVVKKDPSHPRAVVLRFSEDGNLFWLPVEQVSKWLQEMEASGLSSTTGTIGDAASVYAAQVLADFSRPAPDRTPEPRTPSPEPRASALPSQLPASAYSVSSQHSSVTQAGSACDEEECSEALSSLKLARKTGKRSAVGAGRKHVDSMGQRPG